MCLKQFYLLPLIVWLTSYWSLQCKMIGTVTLFPACEGSLGIRLIQAFVWVVWSATLSTHFLLPSKGDFLDVFQYLWEVSASSVSGEQQSSLNAVISRQKADHVTQGYSLVSRAGGRAALQPGCHHGIWEHLQYKREGAVLAIQIKGSWEPPRVIPLSQNAVFSCVF